MKSLAVLFNLVIIILRNVKMFFIISYIIDRDGSFIKKFRSDEDNNNNFQFDRLLRIV